jgi:tripartite-type tricarboxylate transporter receptor subunit TctC
MKRAVATLLAAAVSTAVLAQEYPAREIRSICNFAPGSGADILVRFYSDKLSKLAGKPVIVENKPGANGAIATSELAHSKPDGHSIMITPASSTIAAAPYLFKNLPFDTTKDFQAVTTIATLSFVLLVDASKPIKNVQELVAHLKTRPNDGFYARATTPASSPPSFSSTPPASRPRTRPTSRTRRRSPISCRGRSISSPTTPPGRRGR